jgi:hypothetical protein
LSIRDVDPSHELRRRLRADDRTTRHRIRHRSSPPLGDLNGPLQALLDQFNLRLRRCDAALRLFLKRVQHEHAVGESERVRGTKRVAAETCLPPNSSRSVTDVASDDDQSAARKEARATSSPRQRPVCRLPKWPPAVVQDLSGIRTRLVRTKLLKSWRNADSLVQSPFHVRSRVLIRTTENSEPLPRGFTDTIRC